MKKVLIAGGSGLIGKYLSQLLSANDYEVSWLSRSAKHQSPYKTFQWNTDKMTIDPKAFEGVETIINLAGQGIADKRWTRSRKDELITSRTKPIMTLSKALIDMSYRPMQLINASAIGYYGDRGSEILDESAAPGESGFLVECTLAWEKAIEAFANYHQEVEVKIMRIGIVLSTKGGALQQMMLPAKAGVNAVVGKGSQYVSWIHIEDLCKMIMYAIENRGSQVINGVGPNPVTNSTLTASIASAIDRKGISPKVPSFVMRLAMGEMAEMITTSTRVVPQEMLNEGFEFLFPDLLPALNDLINRKI